MVEDEKRKWWRMKNVNGGGSREKCRIFWVLVLFMKKMIIEEKDEKCEVYHVPHGGY